MRAAAAALLVLLLATFAPLVHAGDPPAASCDLDDDLYEHCNVGDVNVVYGPGCAGVKLGAPAECRSILP